MFGPFQLGKWKVDPTANTLISGKEEVRLQPRFMRVLVRLAERPNEVVSREELLAEVWPGVIVEDAALTQAVSHLRSALGGSTSEYIETIPTVGYRLVEPVRPLDAMDGVQLRKTAWGAPTVAAAALAIAIVFGLFSRLAPERELEYATQRITSTEGLELWPAIDPSGRTVVFAKRNDRTGFDLFVQDVDAGLPVQLTEAPGDDIHPVWSQDGAKILFARVADDNCELMDVRVKDALERKVLDCRPGSFPTVAWSPDDNLIVMSDLSEAGSEYALNVLDAKTHRPLGKPIVETGVDYRRPVFVGFEEVAFVAYEQGYTGSIRLLDTSVRTVRKLFSFKGPIQGLAYASHSRHLLIAGERDGESDLFRADFDGNGSWQRIRATMPSASRTGERIVYAEWRGNANIYSADLSADGRGKIEPLIVSTRIDRSPRWSNAGDRIGFISDRSGESTLWIARYTGESLRRLDIPELGRVEDFDWSPDDLKIVLVTSVDGGRRVSIVPSEGGAGKQIVGPEFDPRHPNWSSDGNAVFFLGIADGSRIALQVFVSDGRVEPLNLPAATLAQGSEKYLYFTRADTTGIWRATGSDPELLIRDLDPSDYLNWIVADNSIFYLRRGESSEFEIVCYEITSGLAQVEARFTSRISPGRALDVMPAGGHALVSVFEL
ncbi:MAG TPA: winged helix-turn-helix domain-containing protein, partial [Rhodothermales bacterium]